jgi:2-polyprenyl-3-methyl-5-hydroxy-6-metoxy-1,4-benzoquinol methylase
MGIIFPNGAKSTDIDYEWKSFYNGTLVQKKWKQWIASKVTELVGDVHDKSVLDIGCGSSPLGMSLRSGGYIGIDIDRDKINFMSNNRTNNCSFYCCSAQNLDIFYRNDFDVVLMVEIIEHFNSYYEAGTAIKEINKVLKPNGRLIIATPNFRSITGIAMNKTYEIIYPDAYAHEHNIRFGKDSLKVLCESYGFKLENIKSLIGADIVCSFKRL